MRVQLAYCPVGLEFDLVDLEVAAGTTVRQALHAGGLLTRHPEIDLAVMRVGVWGRPAQLDALLRDGDRVEIYRPLLVDPKEARRLRQRRQGPRRRAR